MKRAEMVCLLFAGLAVVMLAAGCGKDNTQVQSVPGEDEKTPTGAMGWVDRLRVGTPVIYANLEIYPVFLDKRDVGTEYLTLEEALKEKLVRITEVGQRETPEEMQMTAAEIEAKHAKAGQARTDEPEGEVNTLLVHNHGDKPLFILAGQTVWGGKQDRICPKDFVVAPHTSNVEVPVYCVESGRWHVDAADVVDFKPAVLATDEVRRTANKPMASQGEVWNKVRQSNTIVESAVGYDPEVGRGTNAYLEAVNDPKMKAKVKPYVDALAEKWRDADDLAGFVVIVDGRIRSADVFNDPKTFAKLRAQLVESYAARAALARAVAEKKPDVKKTEASEPVTVAKVEEFLKTAYAQQDALENDGVFESSYGGAGLFGSAGGEMKKDAGVKHLYLSTEEKSETDAPKTPDTNTPAPNAPDVIIDMEEEPEK